MLYNKAALDADLDELEKLDQRVSSLLADKRINGFVARDFYQEHDKLRVIARMKLVEAQQLIGNFRQIDKLKSNPMKVAQQRATDRQGYEHFGVQAVELMERSARQAAYYARQPEVADEDVDGGTRIEERAEVECIPPYWTEVRHNAFPEFPTALGFLEFRADDGRWLPTTREVVRGMERVFWRAHQNVTSID